MPLDISYQQEYSNHSSPEFQRLSSQLEASLTEVLKTGGDLLRVTVTDLRPGSTVVFYTAEYKAPDPATRESTRVQAYTAMDNVDKSGSLRVGGYNVLLAGPTLGGTNAIQQYNSTNAGLALTCQLCNGICNRANGGFYCGSQTKDNLILALSLGLGLPALLFLVAMVIAVCYARKKRREDVINISYVERDPSELRAAFGTRTSCFRPLAHNTFHRTDEWLSERENEEEGGRGEGEQRERRENSSPCWRRQSRDFGAAASGNSEATGDPRFGEGRATPLTIYRGTTSNFEARISRREASHLQQSTSRDTEDAGNTETSQSHFSWDVLYARLNTHEEFKIQRPNVSIHPSPPFKRRQSAGSQGKQGHRDPNRYAQSTRL